MYALIINISGLLLIAFIVWWFWLAPNRNVERVKTDKLTIEVENGIYTPAIIEIPVGKPITLQFMRKDPSSCAEAVVFPQLGISQTLPLNKKQPIELNISQAGDYDFTCPMGMYRGQLTVK